MTTKKNRNKTGNSLTTLGDMLDTAQTTPTEQPVIIRSLLRELYVADIGFGLATKKLKNKRVAPSIRGLHTGIVELIPGFHMHFEKVFVDKTTGLVIEWPEHKVGLVEGSFDYFESASALALEMFSELDAASMETAAFMVQRERTDKNESVACPPKYSSEVTYNIPLDRLQLLQRWMISKFMYHSLNAMKIIRDAGYKEAFNPRTMLNKHDLDKLLSCHIETRIDDPAETVDHSIATQDDLRKTDCEVTVNPWDIVNRLRSNTDVFTLDEMDALKARDIQKAARNFYSWIEQTVDHQALVNESITDTRVRAKEWANDKSKADTNIDSVAVR